MAGSFLAQRNAATARPRAGLRLMLQDKFVPPAGGFTRAFPCALALRSRRHCLTSRTTSTCIDGIPDTRPAALVQRHDAGERNQKQDDGRRRCPRRDMTSRTGSWVAPGNRVRTRRPLSARGSGRTVPPEEIPRRQCKRHRRGRTAHRAALAIRMSGQHGVKRRIEVLVGREIERSEVPSDAADSRRTRVDARAASAAPRRCVR